MSSLRIRTSYFKFRVKCAKIVLKLENHSPPDSQIRHDMLQVIVQIGSYEERKDVGEERSGVEHHPY